MSVQFAPPPDRTECPPPLLLRRRIPLIALRPTFVVLDMLGATFLSLAVFGAYGHARDYPMDQVYSGLVLYALSWWLGAQSQRLYAPEALLNARQGLSAALRCWALSFALVLVLAFGLQLIGSFSRVWLVTWAALVAVWVVLVRLPLDELLSSLMRHGFCTDRIVVVGSSMAQAQQLAATLESGSRGQLGVVLVSSLAQLDLGQLEELAREARIEQVIFADAVQLRPQIVAALERLRRYSLRTSIVQDMDWLPTPNVALEKIADVPSLLVSDRPLRGFDVILKRGEDFVLSTLILLLLSPVLLAVAVAIKLDSPGPLFFRQLRAGFHGKTFNVWKFRSMYHATGDTMGERQTSIGDPRITRVGSFLRRTSLDELPQLFNVLAGEMSLVGPRPHAIGMRTMGQALDQLVEDYASRHRILPGMTGWAQVSGFRGEVLTTEHLRRRVALDLHYIENWSLAFDIWIILRTALLIVNDPKAH